LFDVLWSVSFASLHRSNRECSLVAGPDMLNDHYWVPHSAKDTMWSVRRASFMERRRNRHAGPREDQHATDRSRAGGNQRNALAEHHPLSG
jgi:hypothetical protein